MIETDDLILDKAVFEDWRGIYQNVWSRPESARYMLWKVTESESEARIRIRKTMEFQKIMTRIWFMRKKAASLSDLPAWKSCRTMFTRKRVYVWDRNMWGEALENRFCQGLSDTAGEHLTRRNFIIRRERKIRRQWDWRARWDLNVFLRRLRWTDGTGIAIICLSIV